MLQRNNHFALGTLTLAVSILLSGCHPGGGDSPGTPGAAAISGEGDDASNSSEESMLAETESRSVEPVAKRNTATEENGERSPNEKAAVSAPPGTQWGDLRGRFVFDGPTPQQKPVAVTSDVEYCGPHHPLDESVIVNASNQGLANVLVALFSGRGDERPAVHPSYDATANDTITIDNLKCCFVPHIVLLRTSQMLRILNSDKIAHNTKIDTFVNRPINPTLPAGGSLERKFDKPERLPARVSCSIHPWMSAWLMIRSDPYAAKTDRDGRFEIRSLPAGTWTFQVWHERARFVTEVTRDGVKSQWVKGRFTVDIPAGTTLDTGELRISSDLFGDL